MKIVMLSGNPNTGKTTTLNKLYDYLIQNGATVHIEKLKLGGNPLDFECVLQVNGKMVAIYTMGDYKERCYMACVQYAFCDTLVLAYSDKFSNSIATFINSIPNHIVIPKSKSKDDQITANFSDVVVISNNI